MGCGATGGLPQPLPQVEGHGVHVGLVLTIAQAAAAGVTGIMVADQVGDEAFDGGARLDIDLEVVRQRLSAGLGEVRTEVTDEDLAHVFGLHGIPAALVRAGATCALLGGEAEGAAQATLRTVGGGAATVAGTGERGLIRAKPKFRTLKSE